MRAERGFMNAGEALVLDVRGARLSFTVLGVDNHAFWGDPGLRRVQEHLRQHIDQPFPLGRAAEIAGLEYTYFSEFFHRRVGITFVRWVNALRVSRALELLIDTELPIAEIALRTGYRDVRTMQRNFKQLTGQQPNALRRTFRASIRQAGSPRPARRGKRIAAGGGNVLAFQPAAADEAPSDPVGPGEPDAER
jgi:transcriptional regulator GlxA family with amidase domain